MAIEVADLVASLRADTAGFDAAMARSANTIAGLGHSTQGAIGQTRELGLALGALSIGALAGAVKAASDYQTMLVHVQSNTGATNDQIAAMSAGIQQLASATGAPLDQLATGWMRIHNSGFSAADSLKILTPAMQSALSTGDDLSLVANTLGVAMHEFHIQADQATQTMNILHTAAQLGNSTLGEFSSQTTKAFNMAGGFGLKLVDVAAALATLTQSGQTARNASDGLSAAISGMVKPTAGALEMAQQLSNETGVNLVADFSASGLKARGLANVIEDVRTAVGRMGGETAVQRRTLMDYADQLTATGNISDSQFVAKMTKMARSLHDPNAALLQLFPNIRAFREFMLLTGSQADAFTKNLQTLNDTAAGKLDPTMRGFAAQQATLAAQMAKLQVNVQILAIGLGNALLPAVTQIAAAVVPLVQQFAAWAGAHEQIVTAALAAGAAIGVLTAASIALGPAIAVATGPVGLLAAAGVALYVAWQRNVGGIQQIVSQMWSQVQPVFSAMQEAVTTLQKAFAIGGIGGAFAAIPQALAPVKAQLASLADAFVDWVRPALPRLITALGGLVQSLLVYVKETAPIVLAQLAAWGQAFIAWIAPQIPPLVAQLGTLLSRLGSWIVDDALPVVVSQLQAWGAAFVSWVAPRIGPLVDALGGLLSRIGSWIVDDALPVIGSNLERWGRAFVDWVGPKIGPMLVSLGDLLSRLGAWLLNTALPAIGSALERWGRALVDWVGPAIPPLLSALGTLLGRLGEWITGTALPAIGDKLSQWGQAFVAWIVPATERFLTNWPIYFNQILDAIQSAVPQIVATLAHWAGAFIDWLRTNDVPAKVGQALLAVQAAVLAFIAETSIVFAARLIQWGKAFVAWVAPSIQALGPSLTLFAKTITDWITTETTTIVNRMIQFGKDAVQGFIDGLKAKAGDLKSAAESIPGALVGTIKDHLKIFSPSQVMYDVGVNSTQGLINGLVAKRDAVKKAADDIAQTYVGEVANVLGVEAKRLAGQFVGQMFSDISPAMAAAADQILTSNAAGKLREGELADISGIVQDSITAASGFGPAQGSSEALSAPLAAAIVQTHKNAIAQATPSVVAAHRALGKAAADAVKAGYSTLGDGITQAMKTAADKALATFAAMVPSFTSVAAIAAGRLKRIMAGEEPIGPTPGTLAQVVNPFAPNAAAEAALQQAIAPTVSASTADQVRRQYQQITTAQQQQAALVAAVGEAETTQITSVTQLQLLYHKLHLSYLDQERAAQALGNKDQLDQLKALDQQLSDNYQHALLQLQQYQFQQQQQAAVANAQSRAQAANQAAGQAQAQARYTNDVIGQQRLIADTTARYNAQHAADLAAIAAAQKAHHTAQVAMLQQEAAAHTAAYQQQIAQLRAYLTALQQGHALTMAQIAEEAAARKAALAVQGAAAQAAGAGPTSLAGANVTVASLLAGVSQPSSPLAQAIADMTSQFPKLMQAQGQLVGELLAAGIAQGLGEQGAITYALSILSKSMSDQLKKDWGISSPSRVTYEYGQQIVAGLLGGIRASEAEARAALRGLFVAPSGAGPLATAGVGGAGAGGPVSVTIHVSGDAVTVQGHDPGQFAKGMADVVKQFVQAARSTGPGNRRLQPGVPNVVPGGGS